MTTFCMCETLAMAYLSHGLVRNIMNENLFCDYYAFQYSW